MSVRCVAGASGPRGDRTTRLYDTASSSSDAIVRGYPASDWKRSARPLAQIQGIALRLSTTPGRRSCGSGQPDYGCSPRSRFPPQELTIQSGARQCCSEAPFETSIAAIAPRDCIAKHSFHSVPRTPPRRAVSASIARPSPNESGHDREARRQRAFTAAHTGQVRQAWSVTATTAPASIRRRRLPNGRPCGLGCARSRDCRSHKPAARF